MDRSHAGAPRRRPNYWLRRLLLLLLLAAPLLAWSGYAQVRQALTVKAEGNAPRVERAEPVYLLLLGVDERKDDVGRSDTVILVRLGRAPEQIDVVSIPRDTRITLNGGRAKLNAAYPDGGAERVTEVVAELLEVPRPYYVKINLQAFEQLIDQLGGVEITVDRSYHYEDPYQNLVIDIPEGRQVMDGQTALKFVRLRYDGVTNDDIARIARQQQFMQAVQAKFAEPSSWLRIPTLIATMKEQIATDVPEQDQLPLAQALFGARHSLNLMTLPGLPDDATGDWLLDPAKWSEVKQRWSPE
ncbi:MAG: LCP family protein [Bacillota bacterium]